MFLKKSDIELCSSNLMPFYLTGPLNKPLSNCQRVRKFFLLYLKNAFS